MITVTYSETKDGINHLTIKGHAFDGEYGKDLVCAGVSAIIVGGANSIKRDKKVSLIKIEEGFTEIKLSSDDTKKNKVNMEVILTQLKTIEESNPKRIKIKRE